MSAPGIISAWAHLWRNADQADRRDLICLCCATPVALIAFAALWGMLP